MIRETNPAQIPRPNYTTGEVKKKMAAQGPIALFDGVRDAALGSHPHRTTNEKVQNAQYAEPEPHTQTEEVRIEIVLSFFYGKNHTYFSQTGGVQDYQESLYKRLENKYMGRRDAEVVIARALQSAVKALKKYPYITYKMLSVILERRRCDFVREHFENDESPLYEPDFLEESTISPQSSTENMVVEREQIEEMLSVLNFDELCALILRAEFNLNVSEIAIVLKKTYKATESLMGRARGKMTTQIRATLLEDYGIIVPEIPASEVYSYLVAYGTGKYSMMVAEVLSNFLLQPQLPPFLSESVAAD